jgi:hypothetical protein
MRWDCYVNFKNSDKTWHVMSWEPSIDKAKDHAVKDAKTNGRTDQVLRVEVKPILRPF